MSDSVLPSCSFTGPSGASDLLFAGLHGDEGLSEL